MTAHPYITGIDPCGYIAGEKRSRWPDFWGGNQFSNRERRIRMRRRRGRYRGKLINVHDEHREQIRRNGEKAERKEKFIFTVKWLAIGFVVGLVLTMLTSCGISDPSMSASREETTVTESVQEPVAATIPVLATQEPETVPVSSGEPAAATVPAQATPGAGSQTVTVPEGTPAAAETHEHLRQPGTLPQKNTISPSTASLPMRMVLSGTLQTVCCEHQYQQKHCNKCC